MTKHFSIAKAWARMPGPRGVGGRHLSSQCLSVLGLSLIGLMAAHAEALEVAPPTDLARWGLHCFCITARHTPQGVARADNNGQILWRARTGTTQDELIAEHIPVTSSQILLLRAYGLLQQEGKIFTTAFPAIDQDVMLRLRDRLGALSVELAPRIAGDARALSARLARMGYPEHAYAVVFGYALDGLLWEELRKRDALPDTALDLNHPIWKGAFWAIYPEKPDTAGTNEDVVGDRILVSVWSDRTAAPLKLLVEGISAGANARNGSATATVKSIPIINNIAGDYLHDHAQSIAGATVAALLDTSAGQEILRSIPQSTREQAVVIVAHEFIWDVIEQLVKDKTIKAPEALRAPQPKEAQLEKLVFWRG